MPAPWRIEEDPPDWLVVDARTLDALRATCRLLGVREIHLTNDVLDLDSATFEPESVDRGASYAVRLDALFRQLDARRIRDAKANRARRAEASKGLRRFSGRLWRRGDS